MKIERKENNEIVEFGSLKCGDVFTIEGSYGLFYTYIKTTNVENKYGTYNCTVLENGTHHEVEYDALVKPYPNAKLVLED